MRSTSWWNKIPTRLMFGTLAIYTPEGIDTIPVDVAVDRDRAKVVESETGLRSWIVRRPAPGTGTPSRGPGAQVPLRNLAPARLIIRLEPSPRRRPTACTTTTPKGDPQNPPSDHSSTSCPFRRMQRNRVRHPVADLDEGSHQCTSLPREHDQAGLHDD